MSWIFGSKATSEEAKNATSIFDFSVENIEGQVIPMSNYRGKKAYLVVNVASE